VRTELLVVRPKLGMHAVVTVTVVAAAMV